MPRHTTPRQPHSWNGQPTSTRAYHRALDARTPRPIPGISGVRSVTAEQLIAILDRAQQAGLIHTWTATGRDDEEQLTEVGILYTERSEWEFLARPSAAQPFILRPNGRTTWTACAF